MKCFFVFDSVEDLNQHFNITTTIDGEITRWTIYIIKTTRLQETINELKKRQAKFFVQTQDIFSFADNNLYKSILNNIPIPWIQFVLQNELEILQLSEDLSLIEKESTILPKVTDVFRIFHLIKPKKIKVIIIGQDPYPQPDVADGIAFSTKQNQVPASLKNIFSELKDYENIDVDSENLDLTRWVVEGCFLINSAWTVSEGKIGSHSNLWKRFVENLLRYIIEINEERKLVVVFFGSEGRTKYKNVVKGYKNVSVLEVPHPSPMSSEKGFFGSYIFKKINDNLENESINWH